MAAYNFGGLVFKVQCQGMTSILHTVNGETIFRRCNTSKFQVAGGRPKNCITTAISRTCSALRLEVWEVDGKSIVDDV